MDWVEREEMGRGGMSTCSEMMIGWWRGPLATDTHTHTHSIIRLAKRKGRHDDYYYAFES